MKLFLINLDRNPNRLAHCVKAFSDVSLTFERVPAVDGKILDNIFIESIEFNKSWPNPNNSEIGCFMSHRICWEKLVDSEDGYAAIFEDDIFLSEDSYKYLRDCSWIPKDVGLLRLETYNTRGYFHRWWKKLVLDRMIWKCQSFQPGTGGYIISREVANQLLSTNKNYIPAPIDHFLFDPKCSAVAQVDAYQLVPALCIQEAVLSPDEASLGGDIHDRSVKNMILNNRGKLTASKKIYRELSIGIGKLLKFPCQKRVIIPFE